MKERFLVCCWGRKYHNSLHPYLAELLHQVQRISRRETTVQQHNWTLFPGKHKHVLQVGALSNNVKIAGLLQERAEASAEQRALADNQDADFDLAVLLQRRGSLRPHISQTHSPSLAPPS